MTRRLLAACLLVGMALCLPALSPGTAAGKDREKRESRKSSKRDSDDAKSSKADSDRNSSDSADDDWLSQVPSSRRKDAKRELQQLQADRDRELAAAQAQSNAVQRKSDAMNRYQSALTELKAKYLSAGRPSKTPRSGAEAVEEQRRIGKSASYELRDRLSSQMADASKRHDAKLQELRGRQQAAAGDPGKSGDVQKEIDQENKDYESQRSELDRQMRALQSEPPPSSTRRQRK